MRQATTCLPGQGPERALVVAGEPAKARELSEAALDDRLSPRWQHRAALGPRVLDHLSRMPRAFAAQAGSSPAYGWKKTTAPPVDLAARLEALKGCAGQTCRAAKDTP
jgi:hypothetical protein